MITYLNCHNINFQRKTLLFTTTNFWSEFARSSDFISHIDSVTIRYYKMVSHVEWSFCLKLAYHWCSWSLNFECPHACKKSLLDLLNYRNASSQFMAVVIYANEGHVLAIAHKTCWILDIDLHTWDFNNDNRLFGFPSMI